jgi:hypothetical protein
LRVAVLIAVHAFSEHARRLLSGDQFLCATENGLTAAQERAQSGCSWASPQPSADEESEVHLHSVSLIGGAQIWRLLSEFERAVAGSAATLCVSSSEVFSCLRSTCGKSVELAAQQIALLKAKSVLLPFCEQLFARLRVIVEVCGWFFVEWSICVYMCFGAPVDRCVSVYRVEWVYC